MLLIAGGLASLGHQVDLVAAQGAGEFGASVPHGVQLVDFQCSRVALSLPKLAGYLRRRRPDALIAAMTHSNVMALLAKKIAFASTRIIATEHAELSLILESHRRLRVKTMPYAARWLYPAADAVVAVSQGVARDTEKVARLRDGAVRVIYNPVITSEMLQRSREAVSHPWFAPVSAPVILGVGRLEPEKDFATLLRAFSKLRRQRAARLVILGEGSQRAQLERLASELGIAADVSLPGYCANPYAYMRAASLLCLTSRYEGFGLVLVEALAMGTPVVATDCRSGPREILDGGRLGRLAPVGDTDAIARAMGESLANPLPPATSADLEPYQVATAVKAYDNLIQSLM